MLLKSKKDLCGRDMKELETILHHDRLTLISQFAFNVGLYYAIPGYYPAEEVVAPLHERACEWWQITTCCLLACTGCIGHCM